MSLIIKKDIEIIPYLPEEKEKEVYNALKVRFEQLELARTNSAIEAIWTTADEIYPPHEFNDASLKEWMSKNSASICFEKLQTALAIFMERNPEVGITAKTSQYQGKELLIKELFKHNHRITKFDNTKEKFELNLLKYGTAFGRTYKKKINKLDEPYSETLNVRDVWIDDMAKPLDTTTIRDWMWRKIYQYEDLKELFPASEYPNIKYVTIGGHTEKEVPTSDKEYTSGNQVEVKFYETINPMDFQDNGGRQENMFAVMANDVLLYWGELPYKHKRLSLWMTQFYLRDTESIYGIGIPEILKGEQNIIDKILNMSVNELALAIHPTGFFSGTTSFDNDFYEVEPGKLQRVADTDKLVFINRNSNSTIGVANDAVDRATERIERSTGVSKILSGQEVSGKTAFEVGQAKESGLRRLVIPVSHIKDALEVEGNLTIDLIQELYTQPTVEKLVSPEKLAEYMEKNKENPLVETEEGFKEQQFREIPLNVKKDKDKIVPSKDKETWNITLKEIQFEGELEIDAESLLITSKEVEAQKIVEMYSMLQQSPNIDSRKLDEILIKDGFHRDPSEILISEKEALERQKAVVKANQAQAKILGVQQEVSAMGGQGE